MKHREIYLKNMKKYKQNIFITQLFIVAFLIFIWEILAYFNVVDAFIVSSPSRVITTFISLAQQDLFMHIIITVWETVVGFTLGITLGFIISALLWFSPFLSKVLAPFLVVLNSLPKIALGPVIIVWVGANMSSIIVMAVAISLIVTVLELSGGFNNTDKNLIITIQSFNASKFQMFSKLILPYNIPVIFQSLKVNIGLSLVGVIAGEFLTSKAGLGYLIVYAGQVFKMDIVMMSVIVLGVIAYAMYALMGYIRNIVEKKINHNL